MIDYLVGDATNGYELCFWCCLGLNEYEGGYVFGYFMRFVGVFNFWVNIYEGLELDNL